jgi:predicted dehydrogenase
VRIKQLVDQGVIGKLTEINASFTYDGLDAENIRTIPALGGGSLYDLGPYSAVAPLWITDFAPVKDIATEVTWHPGGSDETLRTTYTIGEVKANTLTSMNIPNVITLEIIGTEGKISTGGNDAFVSHNSPSTLIIETKDGKKVEEFAAYDPYQLMADSFAKKIRGQEAWLLPLEESVKFSEFFDSVFATLK